MSNKNVYSHFQAALPDMCPKFSLSYGTTPSISRYNALILRNLYSKLNIYTKARFKGTFDFRAATLKPTGIKAVIYEAHNLRISWTPHAP